MWAPRAPRPRAAKPRAGHPTPAPAPGPGPRALQRIPFHPWKLGRVSKGSPPHPTPRLGVSPWTRHGLGAHTSVSSEGDCHGPSRLRLGDTCLAPGTEGFRTLELPLQTHRHIHTHTREHAHRDTHQQQQKNGFGFKKEEGVCTNLLTGLGAWCCPVPQKDLRPQEELLLGRRLVPDRASETQRHGQLPEALGCDPLVPQRGN